MPSIRSADGTRISYRRGGNGPPLILAHGTASDHTIWTPILPALMQHFMVYAIDRRGRGGSDPTASATYAIEREAEDIAAVVDAAGEPACLLGHSYGALCALEAARTLGSLRRLILYEPPFPLPPGTPISPPGALERMDALLTAGDREGVVLKFAREIARAPEPEIEAARASPGWPATLAAAHTIAAEVRAVEGYVFDPGRFSEVSTPTLLLLGSETAPFLATATQAIARALPNCRLAVLAGQGHRAMLNAPDLFLHEVIGFLTDDQGAATSATIANDRPASAADRVSAT